MATLGEAEVKQLLEQDSVAIAFDTNAVFGNHRDDPFMRVCDLINKSNEYRRELGRPPIRKMLPAPVYVEKIHDLRQQKRERYDHGIICGFLDSKAIEVVGFERRHAEHVAAILGQLYPNDEAWQSFKRQQCARCLGVAPPDKSRKKCSATLDWLIAGQADAEGLLLVTSDSREEFEPVRLKTTLSTLKVVAEDVCRTLASAHDAAKRLGYEP